MKKTVLTAFLAGIMSGALFADQTPPAGGITVTPSHQSEKAAAPAKKKRHSKGTKKAEGKTETPSAATKTEPAAPK